jgi:hypothetical protein
MSALTTLSRAKRLENHGGARNETLKYRVHKPDTLISNEKCSTNHGHNCAAMRSFRRRGSSGTIESTELSQKHQNATLCRSIATENVFICEQDVTSFEPELRRHCRIKAQSKRHTVEDGRNSEWNERSDSTEQSNCT